MAASNDLAAANFASPQSALQPKPVTIASAATVAPSTKLSFISGTVDIATITPPQDGYHELIFSFTNAAPGDILTTGNILVGTTTVAQDSIVLFMYDPNRAKYLVAKLT